MHHKNGSFTNSLGFILSCVGSAVGLGNIWMFPYRLGQFGGSAFLVPYLFFVLLFGITGLSAEFAIGRRSKTGTLGSYDLCWEGKSKIGQKMGWIPLMGSLGIAIGYSIIIGWVLRSLFGSVSGAILNQDSAEYFAQATGNFGSIPWHFIVVAVTMLLLITGSAVMIEKANKIMMPIFFILFAVLAVRVFFLAGSFDGYKFLLVPRWSELLNFNTWVMAMGQAFFSLSITGSGMIVYGSYLNKNENIISASVRTVGFDTLAALLSAFAIMPAVFAFGIEPGSGPSLLFITIPHIFKQMFAGQIFSIIFFLSVCFAGITSLMNMFEAVIESLQHKFNMNRKLAVVLCGVICFGVGIFLESESAVGNWMDFITIIIVPFGALFGAFSIYYIFGFDKIKEELNQGNEKGIPAWFGPIAKYVYVPLTVIVFILGIIFKGIG